MHRILFLAALTFAAAGSGGAPQGTIARAHAPESEPSQAAAVETGSIVSGVVRNAWSHNPLRRATVALTTTGADPLEAVTYSDGNGAFAFGGVPSGEYFLCARYRGYAQACFGGSRELGRPIPTMPVVAGQNREDIVLAALPLGSVSGTVSDGEGDPVPNVNIRMLKPSYERRKLRWQQSGQATTDDRGEYRIGFVRPGKYRFEASRPFAPVVRAQPDVTNGQKQADALYGTQFYPNSDTIEGAAAVTLNAGNEVKGIDFVLAEELTGTVTGTVAAPEGLGDGVGINLTLTPDPDSVAERTLSSGCGPPDYAFQFSMVPAGHYRLIARLEAGDKVYYADQPVDGDAKDVRVTLSPATALAGHLKVEGGADLTEYEVNLVPANPQLSQGEQPKVSVKADGSFQFDAVTPGIWDIGVQPDPPGTYIKSMRFGRQDVLTEDMELKAGTREPLDIVVSTKAAIVSGNVKEGTGADAKAPGRVIALLAPDGPFEHVMSFYRQETTDANGHFSFKRVTPGHYKIYAFDRMEPREYENPDFLKPYAKLGEAFEAGEGSRIEHDATLIVRGESGSE